jgi:hypothetical protein
MGLYLHCPIFCPYQESNLGRRARSLFTILTEFLGYLRKVGESAVIRNTIEYRFTFNINSDRRDDLRIANLYRPISIIHYATSWKAAGLIPGEVTVFFN